MSDYKLLPKFFIIIFFLLAFTAPQILAQTNNQPNTINWLFVPNVPYHIISGSEKNQGSSDKMIRLVLKKLSEYKHKLIPANRARILHEISQKNNVCNFHSIKTEERKKYAYFSIPNGIYFSNSIIIRKEDLKEFKFKTKISLKKLLERKELRGAVVDKRSYSKPIDEILNQFKNQNNITHFNIGHNNYMENMVRMLLFDRLDYILEFPVTVNYLLKKLEKSGKLTSLEIMESKPYIVSYIMCPKNDWGKKIIDKLNKVLVKERRRPEYRSLMEGLYSQDEIKRFRKIYQKYFY